MNMYVQMAIKLAVAFGCLLLYLNLSGRAQLAPKSAVDEIGNYVLGGIVGGMLYNAQVSVFVMVYAIALWAVLTIFIRKLRFRSVRARGFIDGNALMLLDNGQILSDNMRTARLHMSNLIAALHERGYHSLSELQTVWLETNGQYTILKKGERGYAIPLVEGGMVQATELQQAQKTEAWLLDALRAEGFENLSDVLYAELYDDDGEMKLAAFPYQKRPD